ncbi:T9SS type A sorting domain-containing protein [Cryomorpha ignava]|uniref:T9SS type A sorting domain-containing protein n=1 Tax=Cryomorpha ignava TaxID=101383 RepID=A0A7K3WUK8_9FLAO|nr:T9SS type A sorting domain-containing protein [Cryomorpha ignava]NEN24731.1 T9SS type A sorting domain-containing protein [Cryomorpha ignava]
MKHLYKSFYLLVTLFLIGITAQVNAQTGNSCNTAIPLTVNVNSCVYQTASTAGLTNSGQIPFGASCTGFAGNDLWYSVVLPASGEVYINSRFIPGTSSLLMDINMAVYSGACGSLSLIGCDEDSGSGFYPASTLTGAPGAIRYIQLWDVGGNQATPFEICASGTPTCTSPTATFTRQCLGNNEYQITMNVTSLGDATEVTLTNNGGAPAITGITATGPQVVGPFDLGQTVAITLGHAEDATCNVVFNLSDLGLTCENEISCGIDKIVNYCYGNFDNNAFLYSSPDGSPLTITFNSGLIQSPEDRIIIKDGVDNNAPILYNGSNGGNLAGLIRTATSGSIYLRVLSDAGGSCQDGSLGLGTPWNYTVSCEGLPPCEAAVELVSQTTFAASEIGADLSGVPFSGATQCAGPGNNPDLYFKFTAVGTVTYFRVQGGAGFDPAVEVFEGCGQAQLACTNEAAEGLRELFWVTGLTPGQEYVYRVYHAGAGAPATTAFQTAIAHIPTVQLRPSDCGATGLVSTSIIRSTTPNPNFLTSGFIWEFTELEAPFNVYEVNSPNGGNPQFRIYWFADYQYGRSYSVRIKAVMYQGPNIGDYGPACTISLSDPVGSALQPSYDNGFFQLCDIVKAVPVSGTSNYRWTFDDGTNVLEYNSNSSNYFLPLQNVNGLELGTSYAVNVYVTNGGVETTTSIERTINMAGAVSNTSLNPAFLACGSTVSLGQWTQAFPVCSATAFTFRFENLSQPLLPVIEKVNPTRVIIFSAVPGLLPGDTYSVTVKAAAGGLVGDYSTACEITIAALVERPISTTTASPSANNVDAGILDNSDLTVYPNPVSANNDIVVVISDMKEAQQNIIVEIYDMNGRLMQSERFGNNGMTFNGKVNLDQKVATGVYILKTIVNGAVQGNQKLIIE